jgi:hypothetical protein
VITPLGFVPELAVSVQCSGQTIEAAVGNAGDEPGEVTLAVARGPRASTAQVGVGATTVVSLPLPDGAEGSRADVILVTEDGTVLTQGLEVDCLAPAAPVATVAVDCAAGTVSIAIENTGGDRVVVRTFAEQVALLGSVDLGAGERAVYETEILGAAVPVRVVAADGTDILRTEVEHGCTEPDVEASVSLACPAAEVELRLSNPTDEPRVVTVESGGEAITVSLPAGDEVVLARSLGTTPELVVRSRFGDVLLDRSLADSTCATLGDAGGDDGDGEPVPPGCETTSSATDEWVVVEDGVVLVCTGLQARLVLDCISGVGVVELGNGTEQSVTITVRADGTIVATPVLAVDELANVVVADAAGARITAESAAERLLDTSADCLVAVDRTAAVIAGLLVALLSIVAGVSARFDPWIRV